MKITNLLIACYLAGYSVFAMAENIDTMSNCRLHIKLELGGVYTIWNNLKYQKYFKKNYGYRIEIPITLNPLQKHNYTLGLSYSQTYNYINFKEENENLSIGVNQKLQINMLGIFMQYNFFTQNKFSYLLGLNFNHIFLFHRQSEINTFNKINTIHSQQEFHTYSRYKLALNPLQLRLGINYSLTNKMQLSIKLLPQINVLVFKGSLSYPYFYGDTDVAGTKYRRILPVFFSFSYKFN